MGRLLGPALAQPRATVGLVLALAAGCSAPRIVPVPAAGVQVDASRRAASVAGEQVELVVQSSAWRGVPRDLHDYVTPFLVTISNGAAVPIEYDYVGIRLFDDSRFQYTALPPVEVERILRWRSGGDVRLAATGSPPPVIRRRVVPDPSDWWWDRFGWPYGWHGWPYGWYGWPRYYPGYPPVGDVYVRALPMGALQPGAWLEGFVYFPRLRGDARELALEFHHRVGTAPRVLILPFAVEREAGGA